MSCENDNIVTYLTMLTYRRVPLVVEFDGKHGTLREIADSAGVSLVTLRKRYYRAKKEAADRLAGVVKPPRKKRERKPKPPKIEKVRECSRCGGAYKWSDFSSSKFCSPACASDHTKESIRKPINDRECVVCGRVFQVKGNEKAITCSKGCSQVRRNQRTLEWIKKNAKPKPTKEEKIARRLAKATERKITLAAKAKERRLSKLTERECSNCGTVFAHSKKDKDTCSDKCYDAAYRKKNKKKKPSKPLVDLSLECKSCGASFSSKHKGALYCSNPCRKRRERNERNNNPHHKVKRAISGRLREVLRRKGQIKQESIMKYVGCSTRELSDAIESMFHGEITWDNYGVFGWHVDHIVPCSAFDLTNEDHVYLCFNLSNLRPLWHDSNIAKSNTISRCDIESLDSKYLERLVSAEIVRQENGEWRVVRHAFCK